MHDALTRANGTIEDQAFGPLWSDRGSRQFIILSVWKIDGAACAAPIENGRPDPVSERRPIGTGPFDPDHVDAAFGQICLKRFEPGIILRNKAEIENDGASGEEADRARDLVIQPFEPVIQRRFGRQNERQKGASPCADAHWRPGRSVDGICAGRLVCHGSENALKCS